MKTKFLLSALVIGFLFSGCASIVSGSYQTIDFRSQPSGASLTVDGVEYGITPAVVDLKRKGRLAGESSSKKTYEVVIEMPGYYPYEIELRREVNGWFFGNVLFGGIIGLIIDAATGSMYKLTPDQIIATMGRTTASTNKGEDKIYVTVGLVQDASWEKVGELTKK